jgi:hypothetical protein
MTASSLDLESVRQKVREGYGKIAQSGGSCCSSCGSRLNNPENLAQHIGYTSEELAALPDSANLDFHAATRPPSHH